jgi:hypothetical protein
MNWLTIALSVFITSSSFGKNARTIRLDDRKTEVVRIGSGHSTILNFPTRPAKVILGSKGLFAVEYVEDDLAITALQGGARSNLFVYLEGRRFGFDLVAVGDVGDEIVMVRDAAEKKIKVNVQVKHE